MQIDVSVLALAASLRLFRGPAWQRFGRSLWALSVLWCCLSWCSTVAAQEDASGPAGPLTKDNPYVEADGESDPASEAETETEAEDKSIPAPEAEGKPDGTASAENKSGPAAPKTIPQGPASASEVAAPPLEGGATDTVEEPGAAAPSENVKPEDVSLPTLPGEDLDAAEGANILRIDVTGNRRITSSDVISYLRLKAGAAFSQVLLRRDVRELWHSGFFDDIEVDLRMSAGQVILRFHVRERPSISAVEFEGNETIKTDDLAEGIEVKADTILSRPALGRAIQKIRDMYAEQGYFLAEAREEIVPERNNEVTVRFHIVEHSQVSVRRVTFIGNEEIPSEELRGVMFTGNPGLMGFGSGGPFRQDAFERDIAMISALYYDRGYLQVSVHTPRVMLTPDKTGIEVSVTIVEGPRFKIRQLRVFEEGPDGTEVEPLNGRRALRMMVRAESGDYFNRAELLADLAEIRALYRDKGYANAIAEPQTQVDPNTNEVDVVIPVIRGPMVYFERIEIRGNTKTRDRVMRRQFEIVEGQPFSETGMDRTRRRVTALGYFERVDISTEQGSAEDQLVVYVDVSEKPTGTFQVGAGFSSIESFIATAQVQQANLFGNGQSLSLQAQISGIRRTVNLSFTEPYFLDSDFSLTVSAFDQLRNLTPFAQRSRGGALTVGYPLIEPEVNLSLTYNLTYDEVSTQATSTFFGGGALGGTSAAQQSAFGDLPLANLFQAGITSSLRPAISYDNRDNRLFPTSGVYLSYSTEWASNLLGSDNQFLRHRYTGRFYVPLFWKFVLKLNTNAGMVTSPKSDGVPIFARFFLGGILDVRGFQFRQVGPRMPLLSKTDPTSAPIPNGEVIGGNLMYYQNLELEWPLFEQVGLKAVIFTDLGNAWNLEQNYCDAAGGATLYSAISPCTSGDFLLHMRTSWGFGFRWFSPMGPLRFEWGFPFKPLPFEKPSLFQFTIGNFF